MIKIQMTAFFCFFALNFPVSAKPFQLESQNLQSPSVDFTLVSGETYFDKLATQFESGTFPDLTAKLGANVGRCFTKRQPQKATAAVMMFRAGSDAGPISNTKFQIAGWLDLDKNPDYFDHRTFDELESIREGIAKNHNSDAVYGDLFENNDLLEKQTDGSVLQIKSNGNYLIIRGSKKSGESPMVYCYTFIFISP